MIYAIGDSFTIGDELPSKDFAWPAILSKKLNKEIINKGRPATGNSRMVKRAIDAVIDNAEMIIIGWTDSNRVEFADENGIFDLWAGRNYRQFQDDILHRKDLIKYITAYDVPKYHYANWLRKVILVQSLCKLHNIPCVMFISCGANDRHESFKQYYQNLLSLIDQSQFVDGMSISVCEWVYGTPHGPNGHPLEQGHEIIANKIYEHIRNLGWVS